MSQEAYAHRLTSQGTDLLNCSLGCQDGRVGAAAYSAGFGDLCCSVMEVSLASMFIIADHQPKNHHRK